ncbi:MAG: molecular chaperone DnaJ [Patescibacteria group bacterium]
MARDYYSILGVSKNASKEEVKKAFRKKAHEFHPDKSGGNADKFKEVNEAYTVLSDDQKRAQYDTYGQTFAGAGQGGTGAGGFSGFEGFDFSGFQNAGGFSAEGFDIGDIFGEFFGGRKSRVQRGRDISIDVELSFEESVFGGERAIVLNKVSECSVCKGNGGKPGVEKVECKICNGKGKIHELKKSFFGSFQMTRVCEECNGSGKVPREKCGACSGRGVYKKAEEVRIKVPTGIDDGEMIRLEGSGEAVAHGSPGDLYIKVHVRKHKIFRKQDADLIMNLDVKVTDAILGANYEIETLDGKQMFEIPAGSNSGDILRIRGKGVPVGRSRGDILVYLNIKIPRKISRTARDAVEKLRGEGV